MQLPYSEELNIGYLSRLFDNTSNCYKFFWFQAILRKLDEDHNSFTFDELIDEMIADAWYMVAEYNLRLGPVDTTDNIEEAVKYIRETYGFPSSEKRDRIVSFLAQTDDKRIRKFKTDLTLNVPYRLQAPFYDSIKIGDRMWNGSKQTLTDEINRQAHLMYYFSFLSGLGTVIEMDPGWTEYLIRHREILKGWTQLKLIHYLQNKNPSVPGIADKIEPPESRDLERVRKYWGLIVELDPSLKEIYGGITLAGEKISIDHFVPWQYVAHDELWNLHPTTKSINSSKSNSLPSWNRYFRPLSRLEYRAYKLREDDPQISKKFDDTAKYHINNSEIKGRLYKDGLSEAEFTERLEQVIKPVYDSALMLGFKEWEYD